MIQKINKVQDFGIFNDYHWATECRSFNKFNVFYGWNGSGKTTLGRVFRCLETGEVCSQYPNGKYSIELKDGIKLNNAQKSAISLYVFNQDFIAENFAFFEAKTKAIIFISKEKIDEKKELDQKRQELEKSHGELRKLNEKKEGIADSIVKCHQDAGKLIKTFLLSTMYANVTYNVSTSRDKVWPEISAHKLSDFLLTKSELERQKSYTIETSTRNAIEGNLIGVNIEKITIIQNEINDLINTQITALAIKRLKDNPDIAEWVNVGRVLHLHHQSEYCEFCSSKLTEERINELNTHFNDKFLELTSNIDHAISSIEAGKRTIIPDLSHQLYPELTIEYLRVLGLVNSQILLLNDFIDRWVDQLREKRKNPFQKMVNAEDITSVAVNFNKAVEDYNNVIAQHNKINQSYAQLAKEAKAKIEKHFVSEQAIKDQLIKKIGDLESISKQINEKSNEISLIDARIEFLLGEIKNDTLAIAEINSSLHRFLGRNDISLVSEKEGGYQLLRNGVAAKNLSEGEKTAISLIYFFSKIKEGDNKISDLVIVLDDPISSFDSNHLFNASSYIKKNVLEANQVFILTHNFWFFKQVRDWMLKKNKKDNEVTHVYNIERGSIKNANNQLINFNSEYQYVFKKVLDYNASDLVADEGSSFMIANAIRRILEGFTNFKTPTSTGFDGALELGVKKGLDIAQKERIFNFVNKYSHLDRIESFDTTIEVLLEEGKNVVKDVLWLIKIVDTEHYDSMLRIAGYQDPLL